jgi:hypothetical protein
MSYDPVFQAKIIPVLNKAFADTLGPIYGGRVYSHVAPSIPTYPLLVYHPQDNGGRRADAIGANGWEGLMTFRSIDTTLAGAANKLIEAAEQFVNLSAPGYFIQIVFENPQYFPVEKTTTGNYYTVGVLATIRVYKDE